MLIAFAVAALVLIVLASNAGAVIVRGSNGGFLGVTLSDAVRPQRHAVHSQP
jgi:hypothetical protein